MNEQTRNKVLELEHEFAFLAEQVTRLQMQIYSIRNRIIQAVADAENTAPPPERFTKPDN